MEASPILDPAEGLASASTASIAAAVGWLAASAEKLLGDRSYLERSVAALTDIPCRINLEFLYQLEADIRIACERAQVRPPSAQEFYSKKNLALGVRIII